MEVAAESPVEGVQQVQLALVRGVDEDTLDGEEAAVSVALRRSVRQVGVEEEPFPQLAATGTCGSKVTLSLDSIRLDSVSVSESPPTAWARSALSGPVELHPILVHAPTLPPAGVTLNLFKES